MAHRPLPSRQSGAALVVALIFLVALTLLGVAAMGNNRNQARGMYGSAESTLAFEAAESGATDGENWLSNLIVRPVADCTGNCGSSTSVWPHTAPLQVSMSNINTLSWWSNQGRPYGNVYQDGASVTPIANQTIPYVAQQPRYVVEELGPDPNASKVIGGPPVFTIWYYQVTARGTGVQPDPPAIVQTVFGKGF